MIGTMDPEAIPNTSFVPPGFFMNLIASPPRPTLLRLGRALYPQVAGAFKVGNILSVPYLMDPTIHGWVLEFDDGSRRSGP